MTRHERWGLHILLFVRIFTAVGLIVATFLRLLAANQKSSLSDHILLDMYVQLPLLPRDLIIALLLAAVGFPLFASKSPAKPRPRHKLFVALALASGLIVILCYWVDRMVIMELVYIAIQGIQNYQSPKFLPPEMNISGDVYLYRFALASLAGFGSIILNLSLLCALVACWNRRWLRYFLSAALLIGVALQGAIACWIVTKGAWQLSPYMAESVQPWSWSTRLIVATLVILASAIIAVRWLGRPFIVVGPTAEVTLPQPYFHERESAALLLCLTALVSVSGGIIAGIAASLRQNGYAYSSQIITWQSALYYLFMRPANFIWIAAIIGGAVIAWQRFRSKDRPQLVVISAIDPVEFAVVIFSILFLLVTSAPILGAASFIGTFVRSGHRL